LEKCPLLKYDVTTPFQIQRPTLSRYGIIYVMRIYIQKSHIDQQYHIITKEINFLFNKLKKIMKIEQKHSHKHKKKITEIVLILETRGIEN